MAPSLVNILLISPVAITGAFSLTNITSSCKHPIVRREWRNLSTPDQLVYLDVVQCIPQTPSFTHTFNNSGVFSRHDDLVYTNIQQIFSIHYVGHFLPWHRYLTAAHETMLRDECGYQDAQPYWDWTLNVASDESFINSPVLEPMAGFGGNVSYIEYNASDPFAVPGRTGGGCALDRPFAGDDELIHSGPINIVSYNPRYLSRDLSPSLVSQYLDLNQTQFTSSQRDYG